MSPMHFITLFPDMMEVESRGASSSSEVGGRGGGLLADAWPRNASSDSTCVRVCYPGRIGEEAKTIKHRWSFSRL